MSSAGLDAGIASWWGQGSPTDQRVSVAARRGIRGSAFRWTLYYEAEGSSDPSVVQISSDLNYIDSHLRPTHRRSFGTTGIPSSSSTADGVRRMWRWPTGGPQRPTRRNGFWVRPQGVLRLHGRWRHRNRRVGTR